MKKSHYLLLLLCVFTVVIIVYGSYNFNYAGEKFDDVIQADSKIVKDKNEKEEKKKYPLLVLTFDDGFETDFTVAYELLYKKRGIKGTSYINGAHINNQNGKVRRMSWEQIKELESNGWDIQGHTFSHQKLTDLSEKEVENEFRLNNEVFIENGLNIPEHTAYPYGAHNTIVKSIGSNFRKSLRRINPSGNTPYNTWDGIDFYNLTARGTDIYDGNYERLAERKNDIDLAVENDGILIFFSHEFKESASQYETQMEYYEELIDYAVEKGMRFATISELYKLVQEYKTN